MMTPYGIVYKDSLSYMEQSVKLWQKKYGLMKNSVFIKTALIINIISGVIFLTTGFILKDYYYLLFFAIQFCISLFLIRRSIYTTVVKGSLAQCTSSSPAQIVFYEDKLIFTLPYIKNEIYYDEIIHCEEKNGCITLIADPNLAPFSLQRNYIIKGSYEKVKALLSEKLGNRAKLQKEGF